MSRVGSPLAGWLMPLEAVPDPVFAERMLGDGVAIDPLEGLVRAPVAGTIVSVHAARHAVTIAADEGATLLIHVGLDTVALGGDGFTAHVAEGARVAAGDALIGFDMDAVGARATSLVTPVVLTNGEAFAIAGRRGEGLVAPGEPLFELVARRAATATIAAAPAVERAVTVPLRHGLHARPAARLAACVRDYRATVTIAAPDGRTAPVTSPVGVLALALSHGATIVLRGAGEQAEDAVAALAALIESGMGEGAPLAATTKPVATPLPPVLRGVGAAVGIATGPAWRPSAADAALPERAGDPAAERQALAAALVRVRGELEAVSGGTGPAAAIAAAHIGFLDDSALTGDAERRIAAGAAAGAAWRDAVEGFATQLGAAADRRFAERIDDLRDIAARVLRALAGGGEIMPPDGAILVAVDVLPSQLMAWGARLAGIAAGGGGATSHAAIIAAGLGVPMAAALGGDVERIAGGTPLLLDGAAGTLAIDPPSELVAARRAADAHAAVFRAAAQARAHQPAITRDGVAIEVFANLGSAADARAAAEAGAEGCGLLRTEFAFLDRATPPDEDEQAALYQAVADALGPRPLIARTLDIGADKPVPWLPLAAEENPALGLRGLRIGLARPELLRTQLRALLRVEGEVKIMLPMVVEPAEIVAARRMLAEEAAALGRAAPPLGVMVETPAAAVLAGAIAREAAFLSVGSNDLSQYALAMDRGNPAVAARLDAVHPAVLRLIAMAAEGTLAAGRWIGVCGGMAADPDAVPLLIGLGITELSVPPAAVAVTKAHVRACSLARCRALAARALALGEAAAVRALMQEEAGEVAAA